MDDTPLLPDPVSQGDVAGTTVKDREDESRHMGVEAACPKPRSSLDHPVGDGKHLRWNFQSERFCGFEI
jgi:hypothetical protein